MTGPMDDHLSRREFLKRTGATAATLSMAAVTAAQAAEPKMPMRAFGKTGATVSLLGFGGGSMFLTASDDHAAEMIEQAIASGVTYFDTAATYGENRASEKRYGKTLPRHRDHIFLATKTDDRTYDGAMRSVEGSLKAVQTDYLDLIQMHDVGPKDDLDSWEKPTGALTAIRRLKEQKVVRHIGFTGHQKATVHKMVIERFDFDTVLMALNAVQFHSFAEIALPAAVKRGMGIVAMKTTRGLVGNGPGRSSPKELLAYVWDLPIDVSIVGHASGAMLSENVGNALAYRPGAIDRKAVAASLMPHVTAEQLGWAVEGYRDVC